MKLESILSQVRSNPSKFPRFYATLEEVAVKIREKWEFLASKRAGITVKDGGLGWWGAQYLAQGQIRIEKSGLGYRIYYDKGRARIDFEQVVENGRSPYDIAGNLLANSKKVRISKKGKKYLIVPMGSDSSSASQALTILSTTKEPSLSGGTVKRNKYQTRKVGDKTQGKKSKTVVFRQEQERGGSSSSIKNLVVLTEDSRWNPYPAIKGQKFVSKMQAEVDRYIQTDEFKKNLAEALAMDLAAASQGK